MARTIRTNTLLLSVFCFFIIGLSSGCKRNRVSSNATSKINHAKRVKKAKKTAHDVLSPPGHSPNADQKRNVVLFLGDSLTAGLGVALPEAYPSLVGEYWKQNDFPWRAKNAGVSGDTTSGVLRRLDWVLTPEVHTVFLCIGANDGLRGLSLSAMKTNLSKIVKGIQKRDVRVIIAGMMMPPNYGPKHTQMFRQSYISIAETFRLKRMPFLLEGVAGKATLNQADGIHPNPRGHQIIAKRVLSFFKAQNILQK